MNQQFFKIEVDRFQYAKAPRQILSGFQMAIPAGELVGIMGPNGCGKSTLLYLCSGELVGDFVRRETNLATNEVAFIYQDYRNSLFPWKSAYENIALPLRISGQNGEKAESSVEELRQAFNLDLDFRKLPRFLSGGEQQKISVLRSLIEHPRLMLMDEPCSAMDYASRLHFLRSLRQRLKATGIAAVMVSHSAEESLLFCDRVILLSAEGQLAQEILPCQSPEQYTANLETIHAHFLD